MRYSAFFQWVALACFFQMVAPAKGSASQIVPFKMKGNSVLVQATINGRTGDFIIDTGAPNLMLNEAHFEGVAMSGHQLDILDVHGQRRPTTYFAVEDFLIGRLKVPEGRYALVADLREIEKMKGGVLFGIIGYTALKHFELHFDFEVQELTFFQLGKKGEPVHTPWHEPPAEVFDLKFSAHIPYLISLAGGKKVRLAIDSGSEVNVLHQPFFKKSEMTIRNTRPVKIHGLAGEEAKAWRGQLIGLDIGEYTDVPMDITLVNMEPVNKQLPVGIHGILGIAYLKEVRFSINYKKKELCIWSVQEEAPLAESTVEDQGMAVSLDGLKK